MGIICHCPHGATLPNIPDTDCSGAKFGQIQKVIFQRVYSAPGVKNSLADPTLLASWTPLLTASDSTKVVLSPYLNAPEMEAGAARTVGGDNSTLGGLTINVGREPTTFTAQLYDVAQVTAEALKAYMCEHVGVWLIDEFGNIGCLVDDYAAPTAFYPVPIHALFIGDADLGMLDDFDKNAVSWQFLPNWSDKLVRTVPKDFNPLTGLVSAANDFNDDFNNDFGG